MQVLARRLRRRGYPVELFDYPSRDALQANVRRLLKFCRARPCDFVAHSLGGVLVANALSHVSEECAAPPPGRAVFLGTPLGRSGSARRLRRLPWGRHLLGDAAAPLLEPTPLPKQWEIGVIAGTVKLGLGALLGGIFEPGDGAVSLDETRVEGLRDHIELATSHTGLAFSAKAAEMCDHFLREGCFPRQG